jgi:hypothetical protein
MVTTNKPQLLICHQPVVQKAHHLSLLLTMPPARGAQRSPPTGKSVRGHMTMYMCTCIASDDK